MPDVRSVLVHSRALLPDCGESSKDCRSLLEIQCGRARIVWITNHILLMLARTLITLALAATASAQLVFEPKDGPGKGKHVVLISGDDEYRSEEGMPMLAKILSERHGFKCSVAFSVDADGYNDPGNKKSGVGVEALDTADVCIMLTRFRNWPNEVMAHFDAYLRAGKPLIGLRTSTHAFDYPKDSPYAKYGWHAGADTGWPGGFGKAIMGETWVSHWGSHKHEATRGIITDAGKADPLLRGVSDIFGDTDVYEAHPPADATILVNGQVLKGMKPDDEPASYRKTGKLGEQDVNSPMQAIAWTRVADNGMGSRNKVLCTTMGSSTDLANEGLRRVIVNAVYAFAGLEVPEKADVSIVGVYTPTFYGDWNGGAKKLYKPTKPAELKDGPIGANLISPPAK